MDTKNLFHDLNAHRCGHVWQPDNSGLFLVITKDQVPEISVNRDQDTSLCMCDPQEFFVTWIHTTIAALHNVVTFSSQPHSE